MKLKGSRWLVVVPRVMDDRITLMFIETTVKDGTNAFARVRNEYCSRWRCLWNEVEVFPMD
jgi:hypothetical protein